MSELGKEELLEMLDEAQKLCLQEEYSIDEKIAVRGRFDRCKAIVEQHFDLSYHPSAFGNNKQSPEPGVDEEMAGFLDAVGLALEHVNWKYYARKATVLLQIKQLLTQKRVVSREEILSVVKRINDEITPGGMTTARMVEIAYEELGIEVVEK